MIFLISHKSLRSIMCVAALLSTSLAQKAIQVLASLNIETSLAPSPTQATSSSLKPRNSLSLLSILPLESPNIISPPTFPVRIPFLWWSSLAKFISKPSLFCAISVAIWNPPLNTTVLILLDFKYEIISLAPVINGKFEAISKALEDMEKLNIKGKEEAPFLLKRIVELTNGESLEANIALVLNNARLGALIAKEYAKNFN